MVTMDRGEMAPCCWTPLKLDFRKITKSSSPNQPTGPLSHQVPQGALIVALVTNTICGMLP